MMTRVSTVKKNNPGSVGRSRYVFEILLSLNLAFAILLARSWDVFPLLERTKLFFTAHWRIGYHAAGVPAFCLLAGTLGCVTFVVLRLCAMGSFGSWLLIRIGGVIAVAAIPLCRFYPALVTWTRTGYLSFDYAHPLFLLEIAAAALIVSLYPSFRTTAPKGGGTALLLIHYLLWARIYWTGASADPWVLAFPVVGFSSSLAWGAYIRHQIQLSVQPAPV